MNRALRAAKKLGIKPNSHSEPTSLYLIFLYLKEMVAIQTDPPLNALRLGLEFHWAFFNVLLF